MVAYGYSIEEEHGRTVSDKKWNVKNFAFVAYVKREFRLTNQ